MSKSTSKRSTKAAKATPASSKNKKSSAKKLTSSSLRLLNLGASLLLAVQALVLVLLSDKSKGDVSITANYLTRDPVASEAAGQTVLAAATDQLASINLAYLVATFLVLGVLTSLLVATRFRGRYEAELKLGTNSLRWIAYIFSAGSLLVTAALLVGVSDVTALLMLVALTAIACVLAQKVEKQRLLGKHTWTSRLALIAGLVPVAVIALYVFMAHVYGGGLPFRTLIAAGILGLGLLISFLALNNAYKTNNKTSQYLSVERAYIVFSFLVPTVFAWVIFSLLLK